MSDPVLLREPELGPRSLRIGGSGGNPGLHFGLVDARQQLSLLYGLSFAHSHLDQFAGHFRFDSRGSERAQGSGDRQRARNGFLARRVEILRHEFKHDGFWNGRRGGFGASAAQSAEDDCGRNRGDCDQQQNEHGTGQGETKCTHGSAFCNRSEITRQTTAQHLEVFVDDPQRIHPLRVEGRQ